MFFFRHPRPANDNRPVAMQIVNQKHSQTLNTTLIVVEKKEAESTLATNAENVSEQAEDNRQD